MMRSDLLPQARKNDRAAERRWVWLFALGVMSLTMVPYLAGFAFEGTDRVFTGFVFGVDDGNSYIAKMLSGAFGAWLFKTPYTPYPQGGVLAYLPFILLGKLAAPPATHTQLVVLYHLFRLAAGILAIHATYDFLSVFLQTLSIRRWALTLATLGGGLGWALVLSGRDTWLGSLPLEYYSPESFGFLALYGLPHLAMARAFLLWGLRAYLAPVVTGPQPRESGETRGSPYFLRWLAFRGYPDERAKALWAGVYILLIGIFQPLTVPIAWAVMGAHLAGYGIWIRSAAPEHKEPAVTLWFASLRRAFWAVLVSSPLVFYTVLMFSQDPFLKTWATQNLILSPHPAHYLVAYGLLLPLAFLGAYRLVQRSPSRGLLPAAWLALLPFLAYAPYKLQRRLPEGIWVVLVVLASAGLEKFETRPVVRRLGRFWTGLALPSTLLLLAGGLLAAQGRGSPLFRPAAEVRIFERLADESEPDQIVLAAFETGNALPAWAPLRVIIGHGPESVQLAELEPQVALFLRFGGSRS